MDPIKRKKKIYFPFCLIFSGVEVDIGLSSEQDRDKWLTAFEEKIISPKSSKKQLKEEKTETEESIPFSSTLSPMVEYL